MYSLARLSTLAVLLSKNRLVVGDETLRNCSRVVPALDMGARSSAPLAPCMGLDGVNDRVDAGLLLQRATDLRRLDELRPGSDDNQEIHAFQAVGTAGAPSARFSPPRPSSPRTISSITSAFRS